MKPPIDDPEPGQPYGLGPNAIQYEAQPEHEQNNIDRIYESSSRISLPRRTKPSLVRPTKLSSKRGR